MATLTLGATVETARINELPLFSSFGPLTTADYFAMWLAAFDKTVKIDAQSMYDFMQGVGAGTFAPVIIGDKFIYEVPNAAYGGVDAPIPELAGQNFFLQNENGFPYKTDEFQILNSGGFKLLRPGEVLVEGARYTLTLYSLQGGSTTTTNPILPLLVGAVSVNTNITYDVVNHVNKLIQLRGGSTQLQFTLPLIDDIPDNTIIIIEAMINNTVEHKIQTQGGQYIYINNASKDAVYMRAGEVLWLYRGEDGYYVINQDFAKMYLEIAANPVPGFKIAIDELQCNGQLILKTAYRRVHESVQTFGGSFVSRATYDGDPTTYKAYWVDWDTDNLRTPDLGDLFIRGIDSGTPGRFQDQDLLAHSHPISTTNSSASFNSGADPIRGSVAGSVNTRGAAGNSNTIGLTGGTETRPVNAGFPFKVKI